jgi:hypothetical protein
VLVKNVGRGAGRRGPFRDDRPNDHHRPDDHRDAAPFGADFGLPTRDRPTSPPALREAGQASQASQASQATGLDEAWVNCGQAGE